MLPANIEALFIPEPNSGCWLWLGFVHPGGYGKITHKLGQTAHRVVYELLKGPIPKGLDLDHLCRVRCCVNPDHLEPVTHKENVFRGEGIAPKRAAQTHCVHGHLLSEDNIWRRKARPWNRQCLTCDRNRTDKNAARDKRRKSRKP